MPAPGDQHTAAANPFEEPVPRVALWTAKEIAAISAKLDKQLGPEYISSRSGPGGARVHYLTAEKCIGLANEVFGFNGWSSSIQNIQIDFVDENPQTQRVSIGLSVIVRVTLREGTFHEDIGYGSIENAKGKAVAFEKAKKEGTTDGLKRALRSFGNVLGNCIYDQSYVKQVTKVKAQPARKFDQGKLHRHSDYVSTSHGPLLGNNNDVGETVNAPAVKAELNESFEDLLGELDEADFAVPDDGHPDEVVIAPNNANPARTERTSNDAAAQQAQSRAPQQMNKPATSMANSSHGRAPQTPSAMQNRPTNMSEQNRQTNPPAAPASALGDQPAAFFSARAVNLLPDSHGPTSNPALAAANAQQLFNPKAESPSIRKTPGIDHNSSKPVSRSGQHVPPAASQSTTAAPGPAAHNNSGGFTPVRPSAGGVGAQAGGFRSGSMVNPSVDQIRRIGAPGGPGSPLANRGSYRPPSMKRPPPTDATSEPQNGNRPPLADLPGNGVTVGATTRSDAKRQKSG